MSVQDSKIKTCPALCLHHNDADGRASAAIVRRALGPDTMLHEMNYGEPVPWSKVAKAGRTVVVDFSLPEEQMLRIARESDLIWIDHHISAIEELADVSRDWPGLRDPRDAACILTWRYFFPDQPVPRGIVLIGDRDAWHWTEPETGAFDEGLYQQDTDPENDRLWKPLLDDDPQILEELIARGAVLREARLHNIRRQVENYGYPVTFEGYSTLAINVRGNGDLGAYIREIGYQIAYCYIDNMQNGKLVTFVGLYSADVDVSVIARKFGGGGHKGASGFSFTRNDSPFPPDAQFQYS
jgi:oligoribonuclease NrnB/cAMP/cGMP phosphodiesterase (DHH superfamily)